MVRVIFPLLQKKKKWLSFTLFTLWLSSANISSAVSTKLGQNIYFQQNLNELDHGSNWTGTSGVICS